MLSSVSSSAAFVCLVASALACSPTGSPGTGNTVSPTADFTMTVQPSAEWSYPEALDATEFPQRSTDKTGAQKIMVEQINQAINEVLIDNKYPVGAVKLSIDDVDLKGNIVPAPAADANCGAIGFILTGKTITQECKATTAKPTAFSQKIGGSFDAKDSGIVVTEAMWKGFAVKVQKALSDKGTVFIENLVATPTKAA